MTREEHLVWCKERALQYVEMGDNTNAVTSMLSDLRKHDELKDHIGIQLGLGLMMVGSLQDSHEVRRFIEGFN